MGVPSWDYIVIGAGHNGLSAACTLAEAGASVLVVEQLSIIGGLSASFPYLSEAPEHVLSLGAMDDMFMSSTSLAADLGLARYGYSATRLDHPYGWIGEDGETLLLFHDYERTLADIRYFSPQDARAYAELRPTLDWILDAQQAVMTSHPARLPKKELVRKLLQLAPSRRLRRTLGQILTTNLVEMVAETFESDQMRALCTYWASMIGPIDLDGGGFYCVGLAAVHRKPGVMRPRGGMGGLMNAFAGHLAAHKGEIRTGTAVERILADEHGARGVRLADGTELFAEHGVLATCAPQIALGKLLDDGVLDSATRAKVAMLPANANNSATFKIDMAVSARVGYPAAEARRKLRDDADIRRTALMTGTFEDQIAQLRQIKKGATLPSPPVYMAILSASDRSLAPDGQDVLYLASNVPAEPVGGWPANKEAFTETVLGSVRRYMGGLDAEIGRVVMCPADFEERYNAPRGTYFHVDMTPLRLAMNRPARGLGGYRTSVPGFYLAGAGTHPGGGVSGWPGRLAARTALEERSESGCAAR
ncbi:phytoene desaturase family protein [Nocardia sp. NPDC059246]|uniref:phytoene desaturase family protein n=1 Tax=unclassified Nocardia TaxID=2637762 RepID=UPI0036D05BD2